MVEVMNDFDGIMFVDFYVDYLCFDIDVDWEQSCLFGYDVIVFQFFFFWYLMFLFVKEWQDFVLEYGFVYGVGGDKLVGK